MRTWDGMKDRHLRANDETVIVPTMPYSFEMRQECAACGEVPHICRVCERGSLGPVLKMRLVMFIAMVGVLVCIALGGWSYYIANLSPLVAAWCAAVGLACALIFELNRHTLNRHYKRLDERIH